MVCVLCDTNDDDPCVVGCYICAVLLCVLSRAKTTAKIWLSEKQITFTIGLYVYVRMYVTVMIGQSCTVDCVLLLL